MNDLTHYDIIADIHGQFEKLEALMERMGYEKKGDGFVPPVGHCALFLGDLIDPKPSHPSPGGVRKTLRAVKAMCDRKQALCIMGNHELNAIYFHSKGSDGKWLRHHGDKNLRMHQGTLDDFPDYSDPAGEWMGVWIPWMKSLPFYLDLGVFRAVHACWDSEMISRVVGKSLHDEDFFIASANEKTPEGEALEILLKGIEVKLPEGEFFIDHTRAIREWIRARWWELPGSGIGYNRLVFPENPKISDTPVSEEMFKKIQGYPLDSVPVFFGHYLKPADASHIPERENVACLDHAAALTGDLIGYRWKGYPVIRSEDYISSAVECEYSNIAEGFPFI